jgi:hypothetical protein
MCNDNFSVYKTSISKYKINVPIDQNRCHALLIITED